MGPLNTEQCNCDFC